MKYSFSEKAHIHYLDGKRATGITTILGVISKPFLIPWASKMACEYVRENLKSLDDLEAVLEKAKNAHAQKRDAAGDVGKKVHLACEQFIKEKKEPQLDEQGMKMFAHFRKWITDNKVKVLESEKHLYSESMFLGGICDLIVEIDGQIWMADIKTGSVSADAFAQMSAYEMLWNEMGNKEIVFGHIILGLLKDGTFVEKRSVSNEDARNFFLAAYDIYKLKQKFDSQVL